MKILSTLALILATFTGFTLPSGANESQFQLQVSSIEFQTEGQSPEAFEYEGDRLNALAERINRNVSGVEDHIVPLPLPDNLPEELDFLEDAVLIDTQSGAAIGVEF